MSTAVEALRTAYLDRTAAARAWHEAGGVVVGYLCDVVPDELLTAAGLLPFRVSGDPDLGVDLVDAYVDTYRTAFSSRSRRVGFTTSVLEAALRGDLDFLDFLVVPHTRSAVQSIYRELELARDHRPPGRIPTMYYLDKAYAHSAPTVAFDRDEVLAFAEQVQEWAGRTVTPEDLAAASAERNALRRLLARVTAARRTDPPCVHGSDAMRAFSLATAMPAAQAAPLISEWLDEAAAGNALTGPRIFLAGSPQDHPAVYELIESTGATVVADDHCWGDRCASGVLADTADPLSGIVDRFHTTPACSVQFPFADAVDRFAARVRAARCDAVVFWVLEGDDLQLWETPEQIAAVDRLGLPVLHLPGQPYGRLPEPETRDQVRTFVSTLPLGAS